VGDCRGSRPSCGRPQAFDGRDNALAWLAAERPSLIATVNMAATTGPDEIAIKLPLELANYLVWRRRFDDVLYTATISLNTGRPTGTDNGSPLAIAWQSMIRLRRS